jgi:YD repeat-containing protein
MIFRNINSRIIKTTAACKVHKIRAKACALLLMVATLFAGGLVSIRVSAQGEDWVPGTSPFVAQGSCFSNGTCSQGLADLLNAAFEDRGGFFGDSDSGGKSALGIDVNIGPDIKPAPFITADSLPVSGIGGQAAVYELANQPNYSVALGPVQFEYRGAKVWLSESLPADNSCFPTATSLFAYSGWLTEAVRRSDQSVDLRMNLVKGYLTQHVAMAGTGAFVTCNTAGEENPQRRCNAAYAYRFSYHPAGGGRVLDFYQKPVEQAVLSQYNGTDPYNVCASFQIGDLPTRYWSTEGSAWLDMRTEAKPVIYFSDGSIEELAPAIPADFPGPGVAGCLAAPAHISPGLAAQYPLRTIDRNGNVSTYALSSDGLTETLTDPRGRQTTLTYASGASFKKLISVTVPAPSGNPSGVLQYTVNWQALSLNLATAFPEITCPGFGTCGGAGTIDVVNSIQVPDGRFYSFQYGAFGNLTQVTEPGGAVRTYSYGDQTNTSYAQNSIPLTSRPPRTIDGCAIWTGQALALQKRGVISQTVYPQGLGPGRPANITSTGYERNVLTANLDVVGSSTTVTPRNDQVICDSQVWRVATMPDGSVQKQGFCTNALPALNRFGSGPISSHEWEIGSEIWTAGQTALVAATYNGNRTTGELFYDFETIAAAPVLSLPAGDRRVNRTVSIKDGVASAGTLSYADVVDIDHSTGVVNRNTRNVTSKSVWTCADPGSCLNGQFATKLVQTDTSYFHPAPYFDPAQKNPSALNRNMLHLPQTVKITDPVRGLLSRTDSAYDEFNLAQSFAANLVTDPTVIGSARGNPTTLTSYRQPASSGGPIASHNNYFDTGDVQRKIDANGNIASTSYDFGICSPYHQTLTSTVSAPPVTVNGSTINLVTATTIDCNTGLTLRVTDPNNQSTYSQYDNFGRLVETAGPGDALTPISGFTRDATAPLNGGSAVGNNGQGPTTWIEYLSLGAINQQRTVTHAKDGTIDGHYVKAFIDGLGRTIQTRSEIDPSTSGGYRENVVTNEYDQMGRASKAYVPIFSAVGDSFAPPSPSALATVTGYDEVGRVRSVQPPGLSATITDYGGSGTSLLATATDANGNKTLTVTDVLGRVVQVSRQVGKEGDPPCSDPILGSWCVTSMSYDAAGRLVQTTDPAFNHLTFVYDGLGRKTEMTDPDMGHWFYQYDDNGNLKSQTDAKGQTIVIYYDPLNRIKRKDLPPAGTGPEDTTYFYDGDRPPN